MKIAVVYWSSTGNTEAMAQAVVEFAPMFETCESKLSGKKIALFGSYGWGDGEWMRTWEENCRDKGANLVCDSVICQETPDDEALSACRSLGEALA